MRKVEKIVGTAFNRRKTTQNVAETPEEMKRVFRQIEDWAQDPWAWTTVRVAPSGQQLPNLQFDERAFSKVHFIADGTLLFTESLDGENQPEPLTTRHRPLPGHRTHLGDGDLWRYTADGELVEEGGVADEFEEFVHLARDLLFRQEGIHFAVLSGVLRW